MRIVVFSDSHGSFQALHQVVQAQPGADTFLFLGDGLREFEDIRDLYPDRDLQGVRGNCDWAMEGRSHRVVQRGGKRILFVHGHTCGVKHGLDDLCRMAREKKADIALFGHTHTAMTAYRDGLHLMNPGSVSQPRRGGASYGVVDITPAGIVTSIVELHTKGGRL